MSPRGRHRHEVYIIASLPLPTLIAVFAGAAAVIACVGTLLSRDADMLADRTGLGEAIAGAVFLGATTSIAGSVTSVTAAAGGDIDLAYSNSLGGIAAQTAFLAIGDVVYRRANIEHAAASVENLTQATMLILLLAIPLVAGALPSVTFWGVHPASPLIVALYLFGLRLAHVDRRAPMWTPRDTPVTRHDVPEPKHDGEPAMGALVLRFGVLVVITGVAGWVVARSGVAIAAQAGLAQTVVGALMTAVATSLPELVTTIAAVRRGALQLAVGGIIGGNTFDVIFLAASDAAWRDGAIYTAIDAQARFWALVGIVMTAVLLLGLIRRERYGPANIGVESVALLGLYVGAVAVTLWG